MKSQSRVQYTDLVIFKQPVIFFKKLNAVSLLSFKNDWNVKQVSPALELNLCALS